ncbi:MAG: YceI family protein [Bacteroidota bacterium]
MKNLILIFATALFFNLSNAQNVFSTKTGEASFFSTTPARDIDAKNEKVGMVLNSKTNEMVVLVSIKNFVFQDALMQEHFNENYMESDKYPDASYKGKINETVDYSKDGVTNVTTTGKLKMHGEEKEITEKGTITIKNGKVSVHCEFRAELKDYKIEIPKVVFADIAKTILIKINGTLEAYKSKPSAKIGMSKTEVIKILGEPDNISKTTTKYGTTEMFFYNKLKKNINFNESGVIDYIHDL